MKNKKVLLLNGSPRKKGTSYSFARTLKTLAEDMGNTTEVIHIIDYIEGEKSLENLRQLLQDSHIIVLSSPLYVDCLPYPVVNFFEKLCSGYKEEIKGKSFFAIAQCAFPYSHLLNTLLGSCRGFAEEAGMKYMGGLGYGGGVMINGAHLENYGRKGKKITLAFRLALQDVLEGNKIAPKAQELINADFPKFFARPMAMLLNQMARSKAKKSGLSARDLERKAYLE